MVKTEENKRKQQRIGRKSNREKEKSRTKKTRKSLKRKSFSFELNERENARHGAYVVFPFTYIFISLAVCRVYVFCGNRSQKRHICT